MDYFFRLALAAGFLALPLSLFAEEKGSPSGEDHRPKGQDQHMRQMLEAKLNELKNHPSLTQEQKEKMKAVMQQMEQRRKQMQSKLANNNPSDAPSTKQQGGPGKWQATGNSPKGQGEHFRGGGQTGGEHGGGHSGGAHGGGHAGGHK